MSSKIDSITNTLANLKKFKKNTNKIIINLVVSHKDDVIGLLTDDQLYTKGITSRGARIRPAYSNHTIFIKTHKSPKQPVDRVTLKDTGDFYRSIKIKKQATQFRIVATDKKTGGLVKKYGPEILGLTKESIKSIGFIIEDDLQKIARTIIL